MPHALHIRAWPRAIIHIDGDAFFASCEQASHPEYRGKPVVTGKERGIVTAASYQAQAFGIKRGVPLWEVKKLCPSALIIHSDYELYQLFSKRMFAIMRRFTPLVEEYSIDEAFADITGFRRCYHASYQAIAQRIKETIEQDLGITVSAGLSISKVLAKVASKWQKPSGFTAIPGYDIQKFLEEIPIGRIWGVGPRTAAYCRAQGIFTALDFALKPQTYIQQHFTKPHLEIWQELNGYSIFSVNTEEKTTYATISKTRTFTPPSANANYLYAQLLENLENACIKARKNHLVATGFSAFLKKQQDFRIVGLEATLSRASAFPHDMTTILRKLFHQIYQPSHLYRATGITLLGLQPEQGVQMSLFESPIKLEKLKRIYNTIDQLAERLGKHTVHLGSDLIKEETRG